MKTSHKQQIRFFLVHKCGYGQYCLHTLGLFPSVLLGMSNRASDIDTWALKLYIIHLFIYSFIQLSLQIYSGLYKEKRPK
jgi:hypothetical protein